MVSYLLATLGSHRPCGSGDILFLVAERQDSTCSLLNLPILCISKARGCHAHPQEISGCRHNNLPVYPVKDVRC